jgi:hypothetical protein
MARMRCDSASSATLALDTASRWEADKARMEWMRNSYCDSQLGSRLGEMRGHIHYARSSE